MKPEQQEIERLAVRIVPSRPLVPLRGISAPGCSRMPARPLLLSVIPSAAAAITKPTRWSLKRRQPPAGPALLRSSVSEKPKCSATQAPRCRFARRNSGRAFRPIDDFLLEAPSPMSRSGRSGPVGPPTQEVTEVHRHIRQRMTRLMGKDGDQIRILYGGSITPADVRTILVLPEVGGVLVGGASLRSQDFNGIIRVAEAVSLANVGTEISVRAPVPAQSRTIL